MSSINKIEDTLVDNKLIETQSFTKLFEHHIEKIHDEMYDLMSSDTLISLPIKFQTQSPTTRFAYEIDILQSSMKSKQNSHTFLDSFKVIFPKIKKELSVNSIKTINNKDELELIKLIRTNKEKIVFTDDGLMFWMNYPYQYNIEYEESSVILTSLVGKASITKYLNTFHTSESSPHYAVYINIGGTNHYLGGTSTEINDLNEFISKEDMEKGIFHKLISFKDENYLLTSYFSDLYGMTFYQLTPHNAILTPLESYNKTVIIFFAIIIILTLITTLIVYLMIYRPLAHAQKKVSLIESGDLSVRMGQSWYVEFQHLYQKFDSMSDHIQDLVENEYELKILSTKAELKQLQYQISPHFLYNTYFILCGLLQEEEVEQAIKLSDTMGRFLRYMTNSHNEHALLSEEMEHARVYTEIQQIRYSNRVETQFGECPNEYLNFNVPRLIIQPLIENAFEHGIKNVRQGGLIKINCTVSNDYLVITVEDNGEGLSDEKLEKLNNILRDSNQTNANGIALHNIHYRLKMTFGDLSGLKISKSELGGICCTLTIEKKGGF
ncbi:sensor histidine kinase [Paenibacillus nasutitermitis]|uniref:sensor histidine kinase n=1 Tax=Paenibacillus nasutitermitis TaxID=1652958 RepID=UPI001E3B56C4|nr:histidine kinase [Paenibacillus nasutitermitis]